ncbi:MAG TPA: ribonuclease HII [Methylomirabilota bacterium]|nr:ribonuclease HII [Methylomirabilota bacterium]
MSGAQLQLPELFDEFAQRGSFEEESYAQGFKCVAGLDEVGRGPLAGPVVAAAVIMPRGFLSPDIKDSKLLTSSRREALAPVIKQNAVSWGLGVVQVEEIDRFNILTASFLAMVQAYQTLLPAADCILIDGNQMIPPELFGLGKAAAGFLPRQRAIIKGDRLCISIAAASIVAKVARDAIMAELDKNYPEYGFASHKGYGCAAHLEALQRFGPSPFHRRSFKPVRDVCEEQVRSDAGSLFSQR